VQAASANTEMEFSLRANSGMRLSSASTRIQGCGRATGYPKLRIWSYVRFADYTTQNLSEDRACMTSRFRNGLLRAGLRGPHSVRIHFAVWMR
jgi:hypothetical protein